MFKTLLDQLLPPDIPPLQKWRIAVFAAIMMMIGHVAWACGWLEPMGLGSGFAKAVDLKTLKGSYREIKIQLLEQGIFNAKESECTSSDSGARRFFQSRVQELNREYYELVNVPFNIPPCRN
jgi:hypothetical protein